MGNRSSVLITGSSGFIGSSLARKLISENYKVIGLDRDEPSEKISGVHYYCADITSADDMEKTLNQVRSEHGSKLASVIHLVAYYSFSGEESDKYQSITIDGTKWLILNLRKSFEVDQFIFSSSMLVYAPVESGQSIKDDSPLDPKWPYPQSKVQAENVLELEHQDIPVVNLRIAGVYNDFCHSPTISNQIMRIYEKWITSVPFPGNANHGQAFIHLSDLNEVISLLIRNQNKLSTFENFILGEEEVMSYRELQQDIGELIHNRPWPVIRVPSLLAKVGAMVMEKIPFMREPFIKPWMIKHSDEHFAVDMKRLKSIIQWSPKKRLKNVLPEMIKNLKEDPQKWYATNKLTPPSYRSLSSIGGEVERNYFLISIFNIFLGAWLIGTASTMGQISQLELINELAVGILVMLIATLSILPTLGWVRWINALLASWLMLSPLVFHTASSALYINDTLIAALIIVSSTYSPSDNSSKGIPPGWTYNPSKAAQRIPIMFLAFIGFIASRYLAAYQLGHIDQIWEPFFSDGTVKVLTSSVSKAFPVSDAGLGALTYLLDVVAAAIGGRDRWRSLPWAVVLFGLMIIPSGATSIVLIMLQPISVGAWCTLCLFTAFIMLLMVPPAVDEVFASYQFLKRRKKAGESFWKVFWKGSEAEEKQTLPPKVAPEGNLIHLYILTMLSLWLLFTPYYFNVEGTAADLTYIIASLTITCSIIAISEVARVIRIINVPLGICLITYPWLFSELSDQFKWHHVIFGIILIALSLPRGKRKEAFGESDRIIHWSPLKE